MFLSGFMLEFSYLDKVTVIELTVFSYNELIVQSR